MVEGLTLLCFALNKLVMYLWNGTIFSFRLSSSSSSSSSRLDNVKKEKTSEVWQLLKTIKDDPKIIKGKLVTAAVISYHPLW